MRKYKSIFVILSIIALLNVIFVPMFDVWGGLIPSNPDDNFFEVLDAVFKDSDAWNEWPVIFTMSTFLPCVLMLIMSLINKKSGFLVSSAIGMVLLAIFIIWFALDNDSSWSIGYLLFDLDESCISIGTWIALLLFVISFFTAISSKQKKIPKSTDNRNNGFSIDFNQEVTDKSNFCTNCGNKVDNDSTFCNNCGHKL